MSKKKFEILMSTVNNNRLTIEKYDYTIINQIIDERIDKKDVKNVHNYFEKGISKSRNRALEHARGDICLISDDDIEFEKNIDRKILNAFEANPSADIITFQAKTPNGEYFKEYPNERKWHDLKSLMKVTSIEIAFKKNSVSKKEIKFDQLFGLGAPFPTGEEFIFLSDAHKKGLNILFLPKVIVTHPKDSSGQNWNDVKMIKAKAAVLFRVFGWKAFLWCFILSFKKYQHSNHTLFTYFSYMLSGIHEYLNSSKT